MNSPQRAASISAVNPLLNSEIGHETDCRDLVRLDIGSLHGSTSASLIDVLRKGLIATGQQQEISFAGEMMGGILPGNLNSTRVSVVGIEHIEEALSYAGKNLSGWDPEKSKSLVDQCESWIRQGGTPEAIIKQWRELRENIEEQRIARWQKLSEDEQALVKNPFSVVYGISSKIETEPTQTGVRGELGIAAAGADQITVFVPDDQRERVGRLIEAYGSSATMATFYPRA